MALDPLNKSSSNKGKQKLVMELQKVGKAMTTIGGDQRNKPKPKQSTIIDFNGQNPDDVVNLLYNKLKSYRIFKEPETSQMSGTILLLNDNVDKTYRAMLGTMK